MSQPQSTELMRQRVAVLEHIVKENHEILRETKDSLRAQQSNAERDFRILAGLIILVTVGLAVLTTETYALQDAARLDSAVVPALAGNQE